MKHVADSEHDRGARRSSSSYPLTIVVFSLIAIAATYALANSSFDLNTKTRGFSAIIVAFMVLCVGLFFSQTRRGALVAASEGVSDAEIDRHLTVLDEANEFFSGSLKAADMFRLVSSRVGELVPFQTIVLLLVDESGTDLKIAHSAGAGAEGASEETVGFDEGLAGKCYSSGSVETDGRASIAIPLCRGLEVFGVLQLYLEHASDGAHTIDMSLLDALGTRVAPLILSSIAFERTQTNALTDTTTDLPNERAFYLILENQMAETQRKRETRPLTILSIDIKAFNEINQSLGHAAGDRALNFVARVVKENLRQMDFFARSSGDEFLAILPTASKEVSHEIIARIYTGFFGRKFEVTDSAAIEIGLNFGWAAFGEDGETSEQLVKTARVRKDQAKSVEPGKVLWFTRELVH